MKKILWIQKKSFSNFDNNEKIIKSDHIEKISSPISTTTNKNLKIKVPYLNIDSLENIKNFQNSQNNTLDFTENIFESMKLNSKTKSKNKKMNSFAIFNTQKHPTSTERSLMNHLKNFSKNKKEDSFESTPALLSQRRKTLSYFEPEIFKNKNFKKKPLEIKSKDKGDDDSRSGASIVFNLKKMKFKTERDKKVTSGMKSLRSVIRQANNGYLAKKAKKKKMAKSKNFKGKMENLKF